MFIYLLMNGNYGSINNIFRQLIALIGSLMALSVNQWHYLLGEFMALIGY